MTGAGNKKKPFLKDGFYLFQQVLLYNNTFRQDVDIEQVIVRHFIGHWTG